VRAFDTDERLVGVAFMDVGIYVTSLRVLKNLLLIGDAVKSIMFVAFQVSPVSFLVGCRFAECGVPRLPNYVCLSLLC
jgi:cleavage and polyadenylation specificity factor subunit 1